MKSSVWFLLFLVSSFSRADNIEIFEKLEKALLSCNAEEISLFIAPTVRKGPYGKSAIEHIQNLCQPTATAVSVVPKSLSSITPDQKTNNLVPRPNYALQVRWKRPQKDSDSGWQMTFKRDLLLASYTGSDLTLSASVDQLSENCPQSSTSAMLKSCEKYCDYKIKDYKAIDPAYEKFSGTKEIKYCGLKNCQPLDDIDEISNANFRELVSKLQGIQSDTPHQSLPDKIPGLSLLHRWNSEWKTTGTYKLTERNPDHKITAEVIVASGCIRNIGAVYEDETHESRFSISYEQPAE